MSKPPIAKYKYTLEVHGNSHEEILSELMAQVNGGYMLDSLYEERATGRGVCGHTGCHYRTVKP